MRPVEVDRLRVIARQLGDEDFARLEPPVGLWARIATEVDAELAADAEAEDLVEVDRLRVIARQLGDEDFARVEPPVGLWARIATEVDAERAADAGRASPESHREIPESLAAPVVSLAAHRRRRHRRALVAVAAAAAVVVAVAGAVLARGGSSPSDEPQLVASTSLEALEPVGGATAEVRLVRQDDHLQLELEAHDMGAAPEGQHYELWLLDPASASAEPVSLGAMSGSTSVPVPAGVDPDDYDVVDVSLQDAGQTEHSGHSLLRGTLA